MGPAEGCSSSNLTEGPLTRLIYLKRLEIIRSLESSPADRDKCCRVMAYNEFHGMLIVSQPSFTALAPGYGIRKINMLDQKVGPFLSLHREPIRDMAFHPVRQDQLLSASQEKCVKLTNINTGHCVQRYTCDSEAWSCCWNLDDANQFFVGTKRSQVLLYDTRCGDEPKLQLEFPGSERRPIIGLSYVPSQQQHPSFPSSGLLVLTLGSLWYIVGVSVFL
jgi:WD40 repeat protein